MKQRQKPTSSTISDKASDVLSVQVSVRQGICQPLRCYYMEEEGDSCDLSDFLNCQQHYSQEAASFSVNTIRY